LRPRRRAPFLAAEGREATAVGGSALPPFISGSPSVPLQPPKARAYREGRVAEEPVRGEAPKGLPNPPHFPATTYPECPG
jgi:hypothetical protein